MKKSILILFLNITMIATAFAQASSDKELQRLISNVDGLRIDSRATYDHISHDLTNDNLWTTMDEAPMHENEYLLIGNNRFKLNTIHNEGNPAHAKMTPEEFLNGNDPHYNYSMTERGVKAGKTVSYELRHRWGKQVFVIMPYRKGCTELEVQILLNGKAVGETIRDTDGNIIVNINESVKETDILRIDITNLSDANMAIVIINHNTKQQ